MADEFMIREIKKLEAEIAELKEEIVRLKKQIDHMATDAAYKP